MQLLPSDWVLPDGIEARANLPFELGMQAREKRLGRRRESKAIPLRHTR
jgi:hypothetical protein